MKRIGAKIYYDIADGSIITIIGEMSGNILEMSKEQEMQAYSAFADYEPDQVDYVQLEYGQLGPTFNAHAGENLIGVNLEDQSLVWEPRPEVPDEPTP